MFALLKRRGRDAEEETDPSRIPDNTRVYAIGDIHGRYDLLCALEGRILEDAARHPDKERILVYLGDYIDRGAESREVIEHLSGSQSSGVRSVFLMGNHEQSMLGFLEDPMGYAPWLHYGGLATLGSYGIDPPPFGTDSQLEALAEALREALPAHHLAFLSQLRDYYVLGDYLFVHAGIRPGVPIEAQSRGDLLWVRGAFLESSKRHPKIVVHGHNIADEPQVRPNRIGIDTGAYASGRLTCLVLEGESRQFIDTR